MYDLFRLLFKSSYWRMLLRKASWQEAGMSLRRAHKDKRARKHVLSFALMLLVPFLCIAYLAWLAGSGAILFIPLVIPVILWRARREKQEATPLHIAPQPPPVDRELSLEEQQALRAYLADLTLFYAVMLNRAGSESFLKEKVLPEGFEVTSRRIQLDLLRTHNLWDRMACADREAMMMADGHWTWPYINHVALALEPLRLLRWILRIDFYLPVVGQQLRGDYAIARQIVDDPAKTLSGKALADLFMLRIGRDAARAYLARCMAEGIARGYFQPRDEDIAQWATNLSENLKGQQHEDLILGGKLVSEATEDELRWATSLSQRRLDFLNWIMALLDRGSIPDWQMSVFPTPEAESVPAENHPELDKTTPQNDPAGPAPESSETQPQLKSEIEVQT